MTRRIGFRRRATGACLLFGGGLALASAAIPARADDPGSEAACFKPAAAGTQDVSMKAKSGPFRIAFANGFIGNGWRVQMLQTLKAYAAEPDVAKNIKELRVVSVGTDVAAQIAAMDNFISAGFDAILVDANSPTAFKPVLRRAQRAGVLVVSFDNIFDRTGAETELVQVNQDQTEMGRMAGDWLNRTMKAKQRVIEVRGVPGNSVDRDRHDGFTAAMKPDAGLTITQVVGNWDDGTGQKAVSDALAVNGTVDGVYTQGGSTGVTHALLDAHKLVPIAGEGENGFRKLIAQYSGQGLLGISIGQSPALSAVALKAAIAALQGQKVPDEIRVPIQAVSYQDLQPGKTYFPDLSDTFFADYEFPPCGVTMSPQQITGQAAK